MIQLAAISAFTKPLLIVGAFALTYYAGFNQGQKAEIRKQVEQGVEQVVQERKAGKKAVAQAAQDAGALAQMEAENEKLRKELEASIDGTCLPSDDELRVLGDIAEGTR